LFTVVANLVMAEEATVVELTIVGSTIAVVNGVVGKEVMVVVVGLDLKVRTKVAVVMEVVRGDGNEGSGFEVCNVRSSGSGS
jgi:hypothetical protein